MTTMLDDGIHTAKTLIDSANEQGARVAETAKNAVGTVKQTADHAATSARSRWMDAIKTVASVITTIRAFQADDALSWVGLARRRSPLASAAIFGAGMAVGAGIRVLFAPASGSETRRRIVNRFGGIENAAKSAIDKAGTAVKAEVAEVEKKVEKKVEKLTDAIAGPNDATKSHAHRSS